MSLSLEDTLNASILRVKHLEEEVAKLKADLAFRWLGHECQTLDTRLSAMISRHKDKTSRDTRIYLGINEHIPIVALKASNAYAEILKICGDRATVNAYAREADIGDREPHTCVIIDMVA